MEIRGLKTRGRMDYVEPIDPSERVRNNLNRDNQSEFEVGAEAHPTSDYTIHTNLFKGGIVDVYA